MKKHRIVIASVLKPVDDTRMLEKMGKSLDDSGHFEVTILGYQSNPIIGYPNIVFSPHGPFGRLSVGRLLTPLKTLIKIGKLKPEVLVVNTHELLLVAILIRILFGTKIVYDIRENYYRNILYTEAFPRPFRAMIAGFVRLKEKALGPFFHHFFLAEQGYTKEMSFLPARITVLENKSVIDADRKRIPDPGAIKLLFSGTLAESTGVFHAIELAKALRSVEPKIRLLIIGYCAKNEILRRIHESIDQLEFIQLTGGQHLVPHQQIEDAIFSSDFGIVAYPPSRQSENSVPTKLFEYLSAHLPILLQEHAPWVERCSPYSACIPIQFDSFNTHELLQSMNGPFYTRLPKDVTWDSEARKMLVCLVELIGKP